MEEDADAELSEEDVGEDELELLVLDAEICNFKRFSCFFFSANVESVSFALQIVIVLHAFLVS